MWATKKLSSNLSFARPVTLSLSKHTTGSAKNYMQWTSKEMFPRNLYQIRETVFGKLDFFGIKYTSERKLIKKLAIFDFELICVQEESFRDTKTTIWIGKMSRYLYPFPQTLLLK